MGEADEIERSIQMRLYSLHKRQLVGILILFYVSLFLTFFIGIIGPNVFQSIDYKSSNRSKQLSGPYEIQSDYLDKFHQRLWLTMKPITDTNDDFHQSINVSISMFNPSLNVQVYLRQRTIHCQKKVSQK